MDWFGKIKWNHYNFNPFSKSNGYPVHSWTGWTDWTDQSKAGLVTNTLLSTYLFRFVGFLQCWKSSPSSTDFLPSKWDGAKYSSPYLCSPWMDFGIQGLY